MKIVEIGGTQHLLNMLEAARDDRTRKEALKALFAISKSGQAPNLSAICIMLSVLMDARASFLLNLGINWYLLECSSCYFENFKYKPGLNIIQTFPLQ